LMPVPIYGDQNVLRTFEMVIRHVGRMMTTAYIREFSVAGFILITFRNIFFWPSYGWLGSRVVSVLDPSAEGLGFKPQP